MRSSLLIAGSLGDLAQMAAASGFQAAATSMIFADICDALAIAGFLTLGHLVQFPVSYRQETHKPRVTGEGGKTGILTF